MIFFKAVMNYLLLSHLSIACLYLQFGMTLMMSEGRGVVPKLPTKYVFLKKSDNILFSTEYTNFNDCTKYQTRLTVYQKDPVWPCKKGHPMTFGPNPMVLPSYWGIDTSWSSPFLVP